MTAPPGGLHLRARASSGESITAAANGLQAVWRRIKIYRED